MSLATPVDTDRTFTGIDGRRSTRIERAVPLIILAQNRMGQPFEESTYAISLNLHGCCYPSRHDYRLGTWVGLQIADPNGSSRLSSVRAQVRSILVPQNTRELYQIGVELETPANVWGISTPPEDWLNRREDRVSTTHLPLEGEAGAVPTVSAHELPRAEELTTPESEHIDDVSVSAPPGVAEQSLATEKQELQRPRVVITSDQLVAAMRGKLQRAADKAVHEALATSLEPALRNALNAIEETGREGIQQAGELTPQQPERHAPGISREEFSGELDSRLAVFRGEWMEQQKAERGRAEEIIQQLQKLTAETETRVNMMRELTGRFAREIEPQMRSRLEDLLARGGEEFEGAAARVADRQLLRLMEDSHRMMKEAAAQLDARIAEARSLVQSASGATLDEFRRQAEVQVDLVASEVTQRVTSSLGALDAENRAACEARRRALEQDVARAAEHSAEEFRTGIKAFLYSCLVAAVSAVDEHSKATLEGLVKNPSAVPPELTGLSQSPETGKQSE